jgi:hypothetical protein
MAHARDGHMQEAISDPAIAMGRAVALLADLTRRESATMAFSDALWMMSVLFFAALLLGPLIRPPAKTAQDRTQAH